jgi:hypothetical protein
LCSALLTDVVNRLYHKVVYFQNTASGYTDKYDFNGGNYRIVFCFFFLSFLVSQNNSANFVTAEYYLTFLTDWSEKPQNVKINIIGHIKNGERSFYKDINSLVS